MTTQASLLKGPDEASDIFRAGSDTENGFHARNYGSEKSVGLLAASPRDVRGYGTGPQKFVVTVSIAEKKMQGQQHHLRRPIFWQRIVWRWASLERQ